MEDISDMTEDEKRETTISWVSNLDEFALDEILVEFCGLGDKKNTAQHKPEPPTLRPMSELPEVNSGGVCLLVPPHKQAPFWCKMEFKSPSQWLIGFPNCDNCMSVYDSNKSHKYEQDSYKAVGWLPLPNPNEIKLPC
jgi:hypothetical protein